MTSPPNKIPVLPVIMARGAGTRLWPLSRAGYPKQFLVLSGYRSAPSAGQKPGAPPKGVSDLGSGPAIPESLFQLAARRLAALASPEFELSGPCIVGNDEHRFLVLDQLRETRLEPSSVLLEPLGRNTAPALTLSALQALEGGTDPVLVVTPADQTVTDAAAFTAALQQAVRIAAEGAIAILGITPDRPETGYGYIRTTADAAGLAVARFVEKPDLETARRYLAEGGYYWNSGMFVLRASVWMQALERFRPDIAAATRAAWAVRKTDAKFVRPGKTEFAEVPSESVDYAVMERCPGTDIPLRMVALDAGWNDLGAWEAVWQVADKDEAGNACVGDALIADSQNTLVHATSRLVGVVGLKDVVVVETADAVLVSDRARSQEVKQIVNRLGAEQRGEHALHRKVHRPWGWYDSIDQGERFQVKRIMVKPGAALSLQMHHHRAEHWIVVSGTAEIVNGDKTILLTENQSTYIPLGQTHRLANPGKVPLEIIEVQSGSYLGEDDIVRFEDTYGRA